MYKKKFMSLVLALVMVAGTLPFQIFFAEEITGESTTESTYTSTDNDIGDNASTDVDNGTENDDITGGGDGSDTGDDTDDGDDIDDGEDIDDEDDETDEDEDGDDEKSDEDEDEDGDDEKSDEDEDEDEDEDGDDEESEDDDEEDILILAEPFMAMLPIYFGFMPLASGLSISIGNNFVLTHSGLPYAPKGTYDRVARLDGYDLGDARFVVSNSTASPSDPLIAFCADFLLAPPLDTNIDHVRLDGKPVNLASALAVALASPLYGSELSDEEFWQLFGYTTTPGNANSVKDGHMLRPDLISIFVWANEAPGSVAKPDDPNTWNDSTDLATMGIPGSGKTFSALKDDLDSLNHRFGANVTNIYIDLARQLMEIVKTGAPGYRAAPSFEYNVDGNTSTPITHPDPVGISTLGVNYDNTPGSATYGELTITPGGYYFNSLNKNRDLKLTITDKNGIGLSSSALSNMTLTIGGQTRTLTNNSVTFRPTLNAAGNAIASDYKITIFFTNAPGTDPDRDIMITVEGPALTLINGSIRGTYLKNTSPLPVGATTPYQELITGHAQFGTPKASTTKGPAIKKNVILNVRKEVTNNTPTSNVTFRFDLYRMAYINATTKPTTFITSTGSTSTTRPTASLDNKDIATRTTGSNTFTISNLTPGDYVYTIKERIPDPVPSNWEYDGSEKFYHVNIHVNGTVTIRYSKETPFGFGTAVPTNDEETFKNKFTATVSNRDLSIDLTKVVEGLWNNSKTFYATIEETNSSGTLITGGHKETIPLAVTGSINTINTTTMTGRGTASSSFSITGIPAANFPKYYRITETGNATGGTLPADDETWKYDRRAFFVTVTLNSSNNPVYSISLTSPTGASQNSISFLNYYQKADVPINFYKQIIGNFTGTKSFTFDIVEVNATGADITQTPGRIVTSPVTINNVSRGSNGTGSFWITGLTTPSSTPVPFYFKVTERVVAADETAGWVYDKAPLYIAVNIANNATTGVKSITVTNPVTGITGGKNSSTFINSLPGIGPGFTIQKQINGNYIPTGVEFEFKVTQVNANGTTSPAPSPVMTPVAGADIKKVTSTSTGGLQSFSFQFNSVTEPGMYYFMVEELDNPTARNGGWVLDTGKLYMQIKVDKDANTGVLSVASGFPKIYTTADGAPAGAKSQLLFSNTYIIGSLDLRIEKEIFANVNFGERLFTFDLERLDKDNNLAPYTGALAGHPSVGLSAKTTSSGVNAHLQGAIFNFRNITPGNSPYYFKITERDDRTGDEFNTWNFDDEALFVKLDIAADPANNGIYGTTVTYLTKTQLDALGYTGAEKVKSVPGSNPVFTNALKSASASIPIRKEIIGDGYTINNSIPFTFTIKQVESNGGALLPATPIYLPPSTSIIASGTAKERNVSFNFPIVPPGGNYGPFFYVIEETNGGNTGWDFDDESLLVQIEFKPEIGLEGVRAGTLKAEVTYLSHLTGSSVYDPSINLSAKIKHDVLDTTTTPPTTIHTPRFTNTFNAVNFNYQFFKSVRGFDNYNGNFEFTIEQVNDDGSTLSPVAIKLPPANATVRTGGTANMRPVTVTFNNITQNHAYGAPVGNTRVGHFFYLIKEKGPALDGWDYDQVPIFVRITVTYNTNDNTLSVAHEQRTLTNDIISKEGHPRNDNVFVNSYIKGNANLMFQKVFAPAGPSKIFHWDLHELIPANSTEENPTNMYPINLPREDNMPHPIRFIAPLQTISRQAQGIFTFDLFNLDRGTHYYAIIERENATGGQTSPSWDGWVHDSEIIFVRVIVDKVNGDTTVEWFDDSIGKWIPDGTSLATDDYRTFTNSYSAIDKGVGHITISGLKRVTYMEGTPDEIASFQFTLTQVADENGTPIPDPIIRTATSAGSAGGAAFIFPLISNLAIDRLYYFKIQETRGGGLYWMNDTVPRIITVEIDSYPTFGWVKSMKVGDVVTHFEKTGPNAFSDRSMIFDNRYSNGRGEIEIRKNLDGDHINWAVDGRTQFTVRVRDDSNGQFLAFDSNKKYMGSNSNGTPVVISVYSPAILTDIPANRRYSVVEEIDTGAHFTASYRGNGVELKDSTRSVITVVNTFDVGENILNIRKVLGTNHEVWGVDNNTVFRAVIRDIGINDSDSKNYLHFNPKVGNTYRCIGNSGVDDPSTGHVIEFSANEPVSILDLWPNSRYELIELLPANAHFTPTYMVGSSNTNRILLTTDGSGTITITNNFNDGGDGDLIIRKSLAGFFTDWAVNNNTVFLARIRRNDGQYLTFNANNSWRGVSAIGSYVRISQGTPVRLTGIPRADGSGNLYTYTIEEMGGAHYTVAYTLDELVSGTTVSRPITLQAPIVLEAGKNTLTTVINTYNEGTDTLIIQKQLAGSFSDWGVDENTVFRAYIKDVTNNHFLRFPGGKVNNTYRASGNNANGNSYVGAHFVEFTAGQPIAILGLWPDCVYQVVEVTSTDDHFEASYRNNGGPVTQNHEPILLPEGETRTVTVINTFEQGSTHLIIKKELGGSPSDHGAGRTTEFIARVWDTVNNEYVRFNKLPGIKNIYETSTDSNASELIYFSVGLSATIVDLIAGRDYVVEEIVDPDDDPFESRILPPFANGLINIPEGATQAITVVNEFDSANMILSIVKELKGDFARWGVNNSTSFRVYILDKTNGQYLGFPNGNVNNVYAASGFSGSDQSAADFIEITPARTALITQMPIKVTNLSPDREYEIIEHVPVGARFTPTYSPSSIVTVDTVNQSEPITVTITNDYGSSDEQSAHISVNKVVTGTNAPNRGMPFELWELNSADPDDVKGFIERQTYFYVGLAAGLVSFKPLLYTAEGVRFYKVVEANNRVPYWIDDTNVFVVKVTVNFNKTPNVEVETVSGSNTFTNQYVFPISPRPEDSGLEPEEPNRPSRPDRPTTPTEPGGSSESDESTESSESSEPSTPSDPVTTDTEVSEDSTDDSVPAPDTNPILELDDDGLPIAVQRWDENEQRFKTSSLVYMPDFDMYLELDEDGIPLGVWKYDDENDEWVFDEDIPLGMIPQTGVLNLFPVIITLALAGMAVLLAGLFIYFKKRRLTVEGLK